jgi:hypothetical protein
MESRGAIQLDWQGQQGGSRESNLGNRNAAQSPSIALVRQVEKAAKELESQHGSWTLFAMFQRRGGLGKWEIVAAAPWLNSDSIESNAIVNRALGKHVDKRLALRLSRTAIFRADAAEIRVFVAEIGRASIMEMPLRLRSFVFGGELMRRGYVIAAGDVPVGPQRVRKVRQRNGPVDSPPSLPPSSLPADQTPSSALPEDSA